MDDDRPFLFFFHFFSFLIETLGEAPVPFAPTPEYAHVLRFFIHPWRKPSNSVNQRKLINEKSSFMERTLKIIFFRSENITFLSIERFD